MAEASGATMLGRGFQGLKEQAEGAAKDAGKEDEHHCLFTGGQLLLSPTQT